jgi:hypothetical protein
MDRITIGGTVVVIDYDESIKNPPLCCISVGDGDANGFQFNATLEQVETLGKCFIAFVQKEIHHASPKYIS